MERVTKFRGKTSHKDVTKQIWIYGLPLFLTDYAVMENEIDGIQHDITRDNFDIIPETLSQLTPLTDKNGEDIYITDLLTDEKGNTYVVAWHDLGLSLVFKGVNSDMSNYCPIQSSMYAYERIGDIHSNPELLNK